MIVVADLDIIADAPYRLTCAGFGDILGKYTALADWEIAHLVTGEHICRKVVELQAQNIREVVSLRGGLRDGNPRAYKKLTQALLMSGLAMQMMRHSRPASGVEHHISHLWEMHVLGNTVDALHGEKVGVATGIACGAYKRFLEIKDIAPYLKPYPGISEEILRPAFGALAPYALKENTPDCLAGVDPAQITANFGKIQEIIRLLPTCKEIVDMLHELGASALPADVGIDEDTLRRTLQYCPYARNRLTLYRMTLMMDAARLGLYVI